MKDIENKLKSIPLRQPSPDFYQRVLDQKPISQDTQTKVYRFFPNRLLPKLTAAAAVLIGIIGLVVFFNPGNGTRNILLADVVRAMQQEQWMHTICRVLESDLKKKSKYQRWDGLEIWQSRHPYRQINIWPDGNIFYMENLNDEQNSRKVQKYNPNNNVLNTTLEMPPYPGLFTPPPNFSELIYQDIAWYEESGAAIEYSQEIEDDREVTIITIDGVKPSEDFSVWFKATLIVDPVSNLILKKYDSHPLSSEGPWVTQESVIDYPSTGPVDIFQAGVTEDAWVLKTLDTRPDPEAQQALQFYYEAQKNLPAKHIALVINSDGPRNHINFMYASFVDGKNVREESRLVGNIPSATFPESGEFNDMLDWVRTRRLLGVNISINTGEFAQRAYFSTQPFRDKLWEVYPTDRVSEYYKPWYALKNSGWSDLPTSSFGYFRVTQNDYSLQNNLICLEEYDQPFWEKNGILNVAARRELFYLDPAHDYMCIRQERFQYQIPPNMRTPEKVAQLDFNPEDTPSEPTDGSKVVEFAQTDSGQWYPKRTESWTTNFMGGGRDWRLYKSTSVRQIYLQTNPEFLDGIFDIDLLASGEMKSPESLLGTTFEGVFEQALADIDSRQSWFETPEELANAYFQARSRKDFDQLALLWPGSEFINHQEISNEESTEYVHGPVREISQNRFIIPYATDAYYQEHGEYSDHLTIINAHSLSGRYYIISDEF